MGSKGMWKRALGMLLLAVSAGCGSSGLGKGARRRQLRRAA